MLTATSRPPPAPPSPGKPARRLISTQASRNHIALLHPPFILPAQFSGSRRPAVLPGRLGSSHQGSQVDLVGGLDKSAALFEARRCLSCGNCFECDNCYGVCPDNAVIKLGPGSRYAIDYDYCKGCGICAAECPCEAIAMEPEKA